jgi:DNA-binding HxlR family transcriptional regulator
MIDDYVAKLWRADYKSMTTSSLVVIRHLHKNGDDYAYSMGMALEMGVKQAHAKLRQLERIGIVERVENKTKKGRIYYDLTEKCLDIIES